MNEKTEALIEEARRQVGHIEDKSMRDRLISDLADALATPLDPGKVGSIIDYYHDIPYGRRELIIDALCEAYTEGRLT